MKYCPVVHILIFLLLVIQLFAGANVEAQEEFAAGSVVYLEVQQGLNTRFHGYNDLYVGGLQVRPQWTVVKGVLRLGASSGIAYSDAHLFGLIGPSLAWKIVTIPASTLGSLGNVQLQAEHLWGTWHQKLVGGGCKLELGILMLGITAHRDYGQQSWWFQFSAGYNLTHKKRGSKPFDPMQ